MPERRKNKRFIRRPLERCACMVPTHILASGDDERESSQADGPWETSLGSAGLYFLWMALSMHCQAKVLLLWSTMSEFRTRPGRVSVPGARGFQSLVGCTYRNAYLSKPSFQHPHSLLMNSLFNIAPCFHLTVYPAIQTRPIHNNVFDLRARSHGSQQYSPRLIHYRHHTSFLRASRTESSSKER